VLSSRVELADTGKILQSVTKRNQPIMVEIPYVDVNLEDGKEF
jgi:hypothetical protein